MKNYDNLRRQYAKNAADFGRFAQDAERTGRKVRGQTAAFWSERARIYAFISRAGDAEIAQYLTAAQRSVSERLRELRTK